MPTGSVRSLPTRESTGSVLRMNPLGTSGIGALVDLDLNQSFALDLESVNPTRSVLRPLCAPAIQCRVGMTPRKTLAVDAHGYLLQRD